MKKHTHQDKPMADQALAVQTHDKFDSYPTNYPQPKLSLIPVNILLSKGYTQSDIARYFGVSRQAVSVFLQKHHPDIIPLPDIEQRLITGLKLNAVKICESIDTEDIKKAPLYAKATASAILIDKFRLLEDKSTQNIAYQDVSAPVKALDEDIARLQAQIAELQAAETTTKRVKRITSDNVIDVTD